MLFNLIIFVLFATVAYFQYTEGLFSATITTIVCILAAVLSISYHELVTPFLMKLPEEADAISIVVLFAVGFIILRLIFDKVVPGNIRFPLMMDKIGAGVMGVIAGLFSSGVLAIAAQSLPFGPSIGGYSRQDLQDRPNVTVLGDSTGDNRPVDTAVADELVGDSLGDPNRLSHVWLHQDDLVLAITRQLSDAGSALSNGSPLEAAHPDYVTELFGQRLGIPVGERRVAVSTAGANFHAGAAWTIDKTPAIMDAELNPVRGDMTLPEVPAPDTKLVAVRVTFNNNPDMTDTDAVLRFSPANVRLKAGTRDYYPVGTLVGGALLLENRPDDPMLIDLRKGSQTVDFVFQVKSIPDGDDDLKTTTDNKVKKVQFKDGSFIEVKRYAQADLSGMQLKPSAPDRKYESPSSVTSNNTLGGVLRKRTIATNALQKLTGLQAQPSSAKPARGNPKNNPAVPATPSGKEDNEFLPPTPGAGMGL